MQISVELVLLVVRLIYFTDCTHAVCCGDEANEMWWSLMVFGLSSGVENPRFTCTEGEASEGGMSEG
jgi:hypothetical protein